MIAGGRKRDTVWGWNRRWRGGHDLGEFRPEESRVGPGREPRNAESICCELITMAMRNALDDAVKPRAANVVRQLFDGIVGRFEAQQLRQQNAHF